MNWTPRVTLDKQIDYNRRISGYFKPGVRLTWTELMRMAEKDSINKTTLSRYLKRFERDRLIRREVDVNQRPPKAHYLLNVASDAPEGELTLDDLKRWDDDDRKAALEEIKWNDKKLLQYTKEMQNLYLSSKEYPEPPPLLRDPIRLLVEMLQLCIWSLRFQPEQEDEAIAYIRSQASYKIEGFISYISSASFVARVGDIPLDSAISVSRLQHALKHRDAYKKAAAAFLTYLVSVTGYENKTDQNQDKQLEEYTRILEWDPIMGDMENFGRVMNSLPWKPLPTKEQLDKQTDNSTSKSLKPAQIRKA